MKAVQYILMGEGTASQQGILRSDPLTHLDSLTCIHALFRRGRGHNNDRLAFLTQ